MPTGDFFNSDEVKAAMAAQKKQNDEAAAAKQKAATSELQGESQKMADTQSHLANKAQDYQNTGYGMQNREGAKTDYSQANADYAQSQQARGNQDWVGDKYRDAIEGNGPSVAEKQMNAGRDAAMRDAMSMAAGARGGALARAAAQRGAQYQQGAIAAQTNQQAASLRAQEQIAAREGYANLAAQQRAQDMQSRQLSGQQSQFLTEAELKQRALNDSAMLGLQNASVAMEGQRNANVMGQYDAASQRYEGERNRKYAADQAAKDRKNSMIGGLIKTGAVAGGLALTASTGGAAAPVVAGAGAGYLANQKSDKRDKKDITPIDDTSSSKRYGYAASVLGNSGATKLGLQSNVQAGESTGSMLSPSNMGEAKKPILTDDQIMQGATMLGDSVGSMFTPSSTRIPQTQWQQVDNNPQIYSDERCKKDAERTNEIQEFLSKLEPMRYRYKDPEKDGEGIRYGVMAQDMEKSKMGDTLVDEDSNGMKQINGEKTFTAILASLAELQRENERLAAMIDKSNKKSTNKKG